MTLQASGCISPPAFCRVRKGQHDRNVRGRVYIDVYEGEHWAAFALGECRGEVGGWGRDPKKCTGRDWGMGSRTIQ